MTEAERKRRQAILDEDEKNSKTGINNAEERKRRQAMLDADEKNSQKTTSPSVKSSGSGASAQVNKAAQNTQKTTGSRAGITSESSTGNVRTSKTVNMKADAENRAKQDALANMSDAERQQTFLSDVNAANRTSTPAKATLEQAQKKSDDNWEKEKASYQQSQSTPQRTSADVEKEIDEIYNEVNTKPKENPNARNINRYEQLANPQKSPADRISELEAEKEDLARKEQLAAMSDSELKAERTRIEKEKAEHKEKYGGRAKQLASYTASVAKDDFSGQPEKRLGDYNNELGYVQNEEIKRDDYYNKFHSMSNEERALVAQINAFDEGYDRDGGKRLSAAAELKNKYNYTNDDIVAMTYFYNRYANKQRARDDEISARVAAEKSPFWSSAASIPMNIAGGIGSAFGIADSYIDNKKAQKLGIADMGIDYNHPANRMQKEAQAYRSEFTDNHDLMIGSYDIGDLLYNTAMSGFDSAAASVLPGWGGALVLGINAATSTTNELAQRGLSSEKAIMGGIAAGGFETLFEKVSIGNLKALKEVDPKTIGDVVKNIAKSMGVNAVEEGATEAANIIYDTLAHGDLSNYQIEVQKLIESGVDEKTAQLTVAKGLALQVAESAASGALMGLGFGGATTVPSYAVNNASAINAGRVINQSGKAAGVLEAAKAMPTDTRAYKLSQKAKTDKNGNISDKQIGKIAQAEADYIAEQKKPDSGYFKGAQSAAELGETYKRVKSGIEGQTSITENARKHKLKELERQYTEAKNAFRGVGTANIVKRTVQKDSSYFAHREQRQIDEIKRMEVKHPELIIGDKSVTVSEITDIENGDIKVKTTGGEEISLSQSKARFADADVKRLYDEAATMNKETAKVFLESYDGDDVAEYKRAFEYYYNMGKAGTSVSTIREHDGVFGAILTADAQQRIAEAGLMDKEFKSGVTDWSVKDKSKLYKFEKGVLQAIGEKFGTEFIILDESSDLNAKYLTGTNRIVVYRNADGGVMLRSAAHETYHFVESYSAKDAADLREYVLDALKENGVDIEKALEKYAKQGPYDTREKQISELVADSMFDVFSNVDFINKLATEKPKLTRRITDKIGEWVKAIRSAVKMLSVRGENPEIKALMNDAEKLDTIRNMLLEGYKNAGENFKAQKDDIRTEKPKSVNSFARAVSKYNIVYQAESMEREGATREEIWKKLGVIRDAKGMWVYEIDDSEMKIYPNGDARLRNEEGYKRMTELFNKFIFGEKLTDAEQKEYSELQKKYDVQKKISIDIGDFIVHDKLFEEYPEIEKATFGFDDLISKGKRGYYDKNLNEIVVDNSLKKEINKGQLSKTAIHEIQHAIQHFDGRAGGANIEYWQKRNLEKLHEMQNTLADKKIERAEFFAKLDNELKTRIREVNNADDYDLKDGLTEKDTLQLKLLDDDATGNYKKLLDMDSAIRKLEAEIEYQKKTDNSKVQYYDTAGEIEARETADRLKMTAEERAERMPDLGWDRAVFAEGAVTGYDIINLDNGMSYVKSSRKVILGNNKTKWRKQITDFFNNALKQNPQIEITTINGDVLYITKDTATKARDSNVTVNGKKRALSDNEFFVKLEAATHIDELAELSTVNNNGKRKPDNKNHSFAKDGFTYRTVYFEDSNNQYYKVTLSIGHNDNIATIYNVGQIKKDSMPNGKIVSRIGSKADILSNDIISNDSETVKQNLSERDADDALNQKFSLKQTPDNERDIETRTYAAGDEQSRLAALNGKPEVLFSMKQKKFSYDELIKKPDMKVTELTGTVPRFSDGKVNRADLIELAHQNAIKSGRKNEQGNAVIRVADIDRDVIISKAALRHGIDRRAERQAPALMNIGEILENSIKINELIPKKANASESYILLGVARNENGSYIFVNSIVNTFTGELEDFDVLYSIDAKKESAASVEARASDNALSLTDSTISISNLLDIVKDYFPNILPQSVLDKYNLSRGNSEIERGLIYSTKQTDEITKFNMQTAKENRIYRQIFNLLDDTVYTGIKINKIPDPKFIRQQAEEMLKEVGSTYSVNELTEELTVVYEYMSQQAGKNLYKTEDFFPNVLAIARRVVDQCTEKDSSAYDDAKEIRDVIKETPIYISPELKNEIISRFGSYKTFRQMMMGRALRLTTTDTSATPLDVFWKEELTTRNQTYFPEDTADKDMPAKILEFFDRIKPTIVNTKSDVEAEASIFASEIIKRFSNNPDRMMTKKGEIYKEHMKNHLAQVKTAQKELRETLQNEAKAEYETRITEYRAKREYTDRNRVLRNKAERDIWYLQKRIEKETDNDNIPQKFKPFVKSLLRVLPTEGGAVAYNADKVNTVKTILSQMKELEETGSDFVLGDSIYDEIAVCIDNFFSKYESTDALSKVDGNKRDAISISNLTNEELELLNKITTTSRKAIQDYQKLFKDGRNMSVEKYSLATHREYEPKAKPKKKLPKSKFGRTVRKATNKIEGEVTKYITPAFLFERLGGHMNEMFKDLRNGENKAAQILYGGRDAFRNAWEKCSFDERWRNNFEEVELSSGTYNITVMDLISFYCTVRQNQGLNHVLEGGMMITQVDADNEEHIYFTEDDVKIMTGKLTPEQKLYGELMVEYMSGDLAAERNVVSMRKYGIEKYNTHNYYPLKVSKDYNKSYYGRPEVGQVISGQSSAQRRIEGAVAPLVLENFETVVTRHIYQSALYCGYVLPLDDIKAVLNYRSVDRSAPTGEENSLIESAWKDGKEQKMISIKEDIKNAVGEEMYNRLKKFIEDVDSGSMNVDESKFFSDFIVKAKKAAVMGNLSVVVQQPFSFIRGTKGISPKNIVLHTSKAEIEEMKKWNGCAVIKEIGYFDAGTGRSPTEWMLEHKTKRADRADWSLTEKIDIAWDKKGAKFDEWGGKLASKVDELTWGCLWGTVKKQVKNENPDLEGNALLEKAAERFQDIIAKTQVYDSVFAKSEAQRTNTTYMKLLTAFKGEPITSFNGIVGAIYDLTEAPAEEKKAKLKDVSVTVGLYVLSTIFTGAAKSLVYALRDDDDDKSFIEKFTANLVYNTVTDPIGIIPLADKVIEAVSGYTSTSMDTSFITYLGTSFDKGIDMISVLNDEKSTEAERKKAIKNFITPVLKAMSLSSGVPADRVISDSISITNQIWAKITKKTSEPTTAEGIKQAIAEKFNASSTDYEQLYDAVIKGDEKHYNKVYNNLAEAGKDEKNIDNGLATALSENDERIKLAYQAMESGDSATSKKYIEELTAIGFKDDVVASAINKYETRLVKELSTKDERVVKAAEAFDNGDYSTYISIKDELIDEGEYSESVIDSAIDKHLKDGESQAYENFIKDLVKKDSRIASAYNKLSSGESADEEMESLEKDGYQEELVYTALQRYQSELIDEAEKDPRTYEAAKARYDRDYDEYEKIVNELIAEKKYPEGVIESAVDKQLEAVVEEEAKAFEAADKDRYSKDYDLKNAIVNGNEDDVAGVYKRYVEEHGYDKAGTDIRSAIRQAYKKGHIEYDEAEKLLTVYAKDGTDENDIYWDLYETTSETGSKYDKLDEMVENGDRIDISYLTNYGVEVKTIRQRTTTKYKSKLLTTQKGTQEWQDTYDAAYSIYRATGMTAAQARKKINDWYKQ